jgi:hypothetical protein
MLADPARQSSPGHHVRSGRRGTVRTPADQSPMPSRLNHPLHRAARVRNTLLYCYLIESEEGEEGEEEARTCLAVATLLYIIHY